MFSHLFNYSWVALILLALSLTAPAVYAEAADGLTEVPASQSLTVMRGKENPSATKGIHPKRIDKKEKNRLDRVAMIRFDSEDFGKVVRAAGLRLTPSTFEADKTMRFRVYGVRDGDKEDEKFSGKTYDPAGEDSIIDTRISTMLDRNQVSALGGFTAEKGEPVQFTSKPLLSFVRADKNGTVTLVIVRETDGGQNSTFTPSSSKAPPTLVLKLDEKQEPEPKPEDEPEADQVPTEPTPTAPVEDGA